MHVIVDQSRQDKSPFQIDYGCVGAAKPFDFCSRAGGDKSVASYCKSLGSGDMLVAGPDDGIYIYSIGRIVRAVFEEA